MINIISSLKKTYGTAFAITSVGIMVMGILFQENIASILLGIAVMYPMNWLLMALDVAYPATIDRPEQPEYDEVAASLNS